MDIKFIYMCCMLLFFCNNSIAQKGMSNLQICYNFSSNVRLPRVDFNQDMTIKDAFLFINQRIKEAEAVIEVDILCIDYSGVKAERLNAPCGEFNERNITIMELLILLVVKEET